MQNELFPMFDGEQANNKAITKQGSQSTTTRHLYIDYNRY